MFTSGPSYSFETHDVSSSATKVSRRDPCQRTRVFFVAHAPGEVGGAARIELLASFGFFYPEYPDELVRPWTTVTARSQKAGDRAHLDCLVRCHGSSRCITQNTVSDPALSCLKITVLG